MQIWIDGDACPRVVKEVLYRAAEKRRVPLVLVANKPLSIPRSPFISTRQVGAGPDVADAEIVRLMQRGDLVITADIPLAAQVIGKEGVALDPRGELYTEETIGARLSMRNFMQDLRDNGVETGGPNSFNAGDRQLFANRLDQLLTASLKKSPA
ncbi:MAG: YaiI/YqxD family protein [Deltaproteobacteria bacterium]|nr:YaiI/YqxD family protein [Deltaproteobacteria bacterium]NCP01833.1 YaiI/YqxD family protein [Deltaproteobacteria bacterium]